MDESNGRIFQVGVGASPLRTQAVVLDRALANVAAFDMMQLDVEGAEARVLRGARERIGKFLPVIVCEYCRFGLRLVSQMEPGHFWMTSVRWDVNGTSSRHKVGRRRPRFPTSTLQRESRDRAPSTTSTCGCGQSD